MKSSRFLFVTLLIPLLAMMGCKGDTGPQGPAGPLPDAAELSCADCHDDTNLITGKQTQWSESGHGQGEAFVRGTSSRCAGCHSGNAFAQRIEAGLQPDELTEGDPDPTRQDCRACHMIHETYTMGDFAVRGTDAVPFFAVDGATYDGGLGNLCANCHQPRRTIPDPVNGMITGISSHWGPHHGGQAPMILGVAGAGVPDQQSPHYLVQDTCVQCHMGDGRGHTFEPEVDRCQSCHPGLQNFDRNNVQTDVAALGAQLGDLLVQAGLINENSPDGHPIVSEASENQAIALWNWIYVMHEDKSLGVHNSNYTKALLQEGIARMQVQ